MKKKFNKNRNVFLVILSILVICLSFNILYDKFIKKNNNDKNIIDNNAQEIEVIDYVNYSIDKTGIESDCVVHGIEIIRIPMIDSDKQGAVELNNKLKNNFKIYIDATKRTKEEALNSDVNYVMNYSYEKYHNYISLKLIGGFGPYCGTSPTSENSYYTYDIKNDIQMSQEDLLNLVNLSKINLIDNVKMDIEKMNYPIEQEKDHIDYAIDYINNNLYQSYINSSGEVIIEIKYETFSLPLIYTYKI